MLPQIAPARQQKAEVRFPESPKAGEPHRTAEVWCPNYNFTKLFTSWIDMHEKSMGQRLWPTVITACYECFSSCFIVANLREELKNHHNQRWSGSTSLLDQSHHLSSSCVCPHAPVLPFPRRGMLMETSWLPDCILQGSRTPAPPFSQLKHTVKTQDWGSRHSRVLSCCCVNWSCMLALLMENPHVRADCSSPDAWGAGGRRPRAILRHSHVCNCADHLSTPFVDFINYINTFKGPQLTAKLNKALLKLYSLRVM